MFDIRSGTFEKHLWLMELKQNIYIEGRQDLDVLVLISKLYRSSCVSTIIDHFFVA